MSQMYAVDSCLPNKYIWITIPLHRAYSCRSGRCIYESATHISWSKIRYIQCDTWRNNNVIITSKRCRDGVIMTLSLRRVSAS